MKTQQHRCGFIVFLYGRWIKAKLEISEIFLSQSVNYSHAPHAWTGFLKIWTEFSTVTRRICNFLRDSKFPWEFYHIYGNKELQNIISFEMLHIRTILGFLLVCVQRSYFSVNSRLSKCFPEGSSTFHSNLRPVTKKHSNAHSSLVDYCSRVTEHAVMEIPFSLQLTSISLTSDANLKPVYWIFLATRLNASLHDSPFAT